MLSRKMARGHGIHPRISPKSCEESSVKSKFGNGAFVELLSKFFLREEKTVRAYVPSISHVHISTEVSKYVLPG